MANPMLDILVIAPHPDDAELGAAGAILKFKNEGAHRKAHPSRTKILHPYFNPAAIFRISSALRSPANGWPGIRYFPFSSPPIRTGS